MRNMWPSWLQHVTYVYVLMWSYICDTICYVSDAVYADGFCSAGRTGSRDPCLLCRKQTNTEIVFQSKGVWANVGSVSFLHFRDLTFTFTLHCLSLHHIVLAYLALAYISLHYIVLPCVGLPWIIIIIWFYFASSYSLHCIIWLCPT